MSEKLPVVTEWAPKAIGPYSQGVVSGGLLFVSGQIPLDPVTGLLVEGGIVPQAMRVFTNLRAVVEAGGSSMDKVLKVTVYLKNMADFAAVNEIYARFFAEPYPARAALQAAALPKDALVEADAVAAL